MNVRRPINNRVELVVLMVLFVASSYLQEMHLISVRVFVALVLLASLLVAISSSLRKGKSWKEALRALGEINMQAEDEREELEKYRAGFQAYQMMMNLGALAIVAYFLAFQFTDLVNAAWLPALAGVIMVAGTLTFRLSLRKVEVEVSMKQIPADGVEHEGAPKRKEKLMAGFIYIANFLPFAGPAFFALFNVAMLSEKRYYSSYVKFHLNQSLRIAAVLDAAAFIFLGLGLVVGNYTLHTSYDFISWGFMILSLLSLLSMMFLELRGAWFGFRGVQRKIFPGKYEFLP